MVSPEDIKGWIESNLAGAQVEISGDGHHFEAEIVWAVAQTISALKFIHLPDE